MWVRNGLRKNYKCEGGRWGRGETAAEHGVARSRHADRIKGKDSAGNGLPKDEPLLKT